MELHEENSPPIEVVSVKSVKLPKTPLSDSKTMHNSNMVVDDVSGVIQRVIKQVWDIFDQPENKWSASDCYLKVSYLELYNDTVTDLLKSNEELYKTRNSSKEKQEFQNHDSSIYQIKKVNSKG
jgi:hypothetical protein